MVSIIDVLCNRRDVIVYDGESHACIIDGVRLHRGIGMFSSTTTLLILESSYNVLLL
jgi:hypothetical protein